MPKRSRSSAEAKAAADAGAEADAPASSRDAPPETACGRFVGELVDLTRRRPPLLAARVAGARLVGRVYRNFRAGSAQAHQLPTDGFQPHLVAGGQDGEIYRHLRFHAGCVLLGLPGLAASAFLDAADRRQANAGRAESAVELIDNEAGRTAGRLLATAFRGDLSEPALEAALLRLLHE